MSSRTINSLSGAAALQGTDLFVAAQGGSATLVKATFSQIITYLQANYADSSFGNGTVGAPSIAFLSDTDTGFYRIGANNIGVSCGGTKYFDIGAAGLKFVGDLYLQGTTAVPGLANTSTGAFIESGSNALFLSRTSGGYVLYLNENVDANLASFSRSGTNVGSISVTTTATAFNTSSDHRRKMKFDESGIDWGVVIDAVPVVDFEFKADPGTVKLGTVAQWCHPVFPQAVTPPMHDENQWQTDYSQLAPLALWGVQDLRRRVAALEARA